MGTHFINVLRLIVSHFYVSKGKTSSYMEKDNWRAVPFRFFSYFFCWSIYFYFIRVNPFFGTYVCRNEQSGQTGAARVGHSQKYLCALNYSWRSRKQVGQRLLDLWNHLELANDRVMHAISGSTTTSISSSDCLSPGRPRKKRNSWPSKSK